MNGCTRAGTRRLAGRGAGRATVLLALVLLHGCGRAAPPPRTIEFSGPAMGASWSVKMVPGEGGLSSEDSRDLDRRIRDDLARLNLLMSTWDPESELSRFNASTSTEPFPISPETAEVFRWALELAGITGGALDVTLAPVVEAWGFGAAPEAGAPPDEGTLARLREATGTHHLELDPEGRWVRKHHPGVRVDFSALAPGYAADRLARLVTERGFADCLIDVGGELVARGRNEQGEPWQVGVERPDVRGRVVVRVVPLVDTAIATSGDYRNYREVDGERIAHIIDPRTARPIRHRLASVTVIDPLAVRADALATALMVLGPDEGMAFSGRLDMAVLFLVRNEAGGIDEWMSPRFETLTGVQGRAALRSPL